MVEVHQKTWNLGIQALQTERAATVRTRMQEAIDNRCEQMKLCTSKMLGSILDRRRGKVVIDRVQKEVNGMVTNLYSGRARNPKGLSSARSTVKHVIHGQEPTETGP
ncbi:hypothetical protein B0O80DRAFT_406415 [Mortierella sp. GBAus27b]|nr:hypothetical protein B0O80DRAFT_406415 [Mortierella sp. GBAus27b]